MIRIIAIYGHADCGKTATINKIKDLICYNGGKSLSKNHSRIGDKPETFIYNESVICVCPGGDTEVIVRKNFEYAYSKQADIIITATRSRGGSMDEVVNQANSHNISTEFFQKSYEYHLPTSVQDYCNEEFAKVVFSII